jgi:hypothetical protein
MRIRALAVALLAFGCVPASEEAAPAGAAGFATEPSEAARGESFRTDDGWTIHIERLVMQVAVTATVQEGLGGGLQVFLFDAQRPTDLYVPGIPVGTVRVDFDLHGRFPTDDGFDWYDRAVLLGIDEKTERRFEPPPPEGKTRRSGKNILLVARAERDGVVIRIDATLYGSRATVDESPFGSETGIPVEVKADALAAAPLPIRVEEIFPRFDPIAVADADGDGLITDAELAAASDVGTTLNEKTPAMFGR